MDAEASASRSAAQKRALELVHKTIKFLDDALLATLSAQSHSGAASGATGSGSPAGEAVEKLNESIRRRMIEVASARDGVGAAAVMYAAAFALEKKLAAVQSGDRGENSSADILLGAMCIAATSLCDGFMRGLEEHGEAARCMVDVLLSPRCIAVASASFSGDTSSSASLDIAVHLGALVYTAAISYAPGQGSPEALRGESLKSLVTAMVPLCQRFAQALAHSAAGMLGGSRSVHPSFQASSG